MGIEIDLDNLLDLVHDRFFSLSRCVYRRDKADFLLPFGDEADRTFDQQLMRITNVLAVDIKDDARVETYDINTVVLSASDVRIISAFPMEIKLATGSGARIHVTRNT